MQKLFFFIGYITIAFGIKAQTFTGVGGAIPASSSTQTFFPITVSGIGAISASHGLSKVCLDITHPNDDEIEILLKAPDGTIVPLTVQNGGSGNDYTGTCFTAIATGSVKFGIAPFTGTFLPEGYLGAVNNGQNADGMWNLCVQDRRGPTNSGAVISWSLTFDNSPAPVSPSIPSCGNTVPSTSDCAGATAVCDFNGLCGSTSGSTVNSWSGSGLTSCFGLENNSFIKFIAAANTATFTVWVPTNTDGPLGGIQMLFFSGVCNSGSVTTYGCYPHIYPYSNPSIPLATIVTANGLTPGNTYYLMFDGFGGDKCSFRIEANSGVNILKITPATPAVCKGQNINLVASGSDGPYTWSPATGLNTTAGANVTVATPSTATYTVSSTTSTGCNLTKDVTVIVNDLPLITIQPSPDTQRVCQNGPVSALNIVASAGSGSISSYQWYITTTASNTGGSMIPFATTATYTPSTSTTGTIYFYCKVTNSNGCIDTSDVSGPVIISQMVSTPTASTTVQPTCLAPRGTIVVTAPAGVNIQYSDGGAYQTAGIFTGLTSATYNIAAKNIVTGCISNTKTVTVNPLPPGPATPSALVTVQPTCVAPTGTIVISSPAGATIEYSVGGNYQAGANFPGLSNGITYKITAKDIITGCISDTFALSINTVPGAPASPVASISTQPDCNNATGTITITVPSGPAIEYSIGLAYQASGVFAGLSPGVTYPVTAKDNSSGCISIPLDLTINTITPVTAPIVASPVNYCQNATATALTATGSNLIWYTAAFGGAGSSAAPVPSTAATGNTDYYVSQSTGTCESPRAQITVSVTVQPAAPIVISPVTYCENVTTVPLTATGTSLLWYTAASGGNGATGAPMPLSTTAGNIIYYVSQATSGCESPRSAITVITNAIPQAPVVTNTVTWCKDAAATALIATGNNLRWYTVSSSGTGSATAPVPLTTIAGNADYYVSQTINGCEGPRSSISVTVNATTALPLVTSPVTYCENTTASALTAAGSNLLWYSAASGGIGSAIPPVPLTTITGNTVYYVSQTINNCEGARAAITVTVIAGALPPTVVSPVTYCQNSVPASLTAAGSNLLWYAASTGGTGSATAPIPSTATPGNTFYYVTQTVTGCESARRAITVTVNVESTSVTGFKYNPDIVCINSNNPGPAYDLGFTNGGTFTAEPPGLNINPATGDINLTGSSIGSYTVTYTYNTTGCVAGSSFSSPVTINPAVPTVTVFSYTSPVCKNASDPGPNLATGFTSGGTFSSRQGLAVNSATGMIDVANSVPGTYQVTYNIPALGCRLATSNFSFITIVDTTLPVTEFSYSPNNICISSATNPALVTAPGFTTAGGSFSATPAGLSINSTTGTVITGLSVPGIYTITYNVPSFICRLPGSYSTTFTITAYANPETGFSYVSPVCKGDGTAIPVPATGFFDGGVFSSGTGLSINPGSGVIDLTQSIAGSYLIKYDVAQGVCNPSGSGTAPIDILTQPVRPEVTPAFICGPGILDLNAAALGVISWYTEPDLLNQVNIGSTYATLLNSTTAFYLTNTIGTCASEAAILTATVNPIPTAPLLGNDTAICSVDRLVLNAAGSYSSYLWQDGSTQPVIAVTGSGKYKVTVSTGTGCETSSSININVLDNCDDISFPTGFSPNGDGLNDKFGPLGNLFLVKNYSLKVFNRYGEIVFTSGNPYERWDGTVHGKQKGVNNYVWIAAYIYNNRVTKIQKGNITIVQ